MRSFAVCRFVFSYTVQVTKRVRIRLFHTELHGFPCFSEAILSILTFSHHLLHPTDRPVFPVAVHTERIKRAHLCVYGPQRAHLCVYGPQGAQGSQTRSTKGTECTGNFGHCCGVVGKTLNKPKAKRRS